MQPSADRDFELVKACQEPDSDAFEAAFEGIYTQYRDRVYSLAYRITGSSADAMDVLQEAFSLLFRKIGGFRFDSLFSTWLFRIVVNCSIDHVRRERSRGSSRVASLADLPVSAEPAEDDSHEPSRRAQGHELDQHIHRSIQRLSPKLRAILVLRYLESQSYEELSETLAVSIGTVKSRLARAHLALEQVLRGTLEPFGYSEAGVRPELARGA